MALSESTLQTELEGLTPTSDPDAPAAALAAAYGEYMSDAQCQAGTILSAGIPAAVAAMTSAMTFNVGDDEYEGAAVVYAGMTAFWGVMVASPSAYWAGAVAITPPTFSGDGIGDAFLDNKDNEENLSTSMAAIAAEMHALSDGIGTATFPGPQVTVIT